MAAPPTAETSVTKPAFAYLAICAVLLLFQGIGLFISVSTTSDPALLIVPATLVVLVLPGLLLHPLWPLMRKAAGEGGFCAAFTLMVAFSFVVQLVLCVAVFVLGLNIVHAGIAFFVLNVGLFATAIGTGAWKRASGLFAAAGSDATNRIVFGAFLVLFSVLLYVLGTPPYTVGGEMLVQLSAVRKIAENPILAVDNVHYARDTTGAYVFPVWYATVALISRVAHVDPLIVYFKLRWFGAAFSLLSIAAIANMVFKRSKVTGLIMNVVAVLAFTGLYLSYYGSRPGDGDLNRGALNLLPLPHSADIAMVVVLPAAVFVALFLWRHGGRLLFAFSTLFFLGVAVLHVREYFQMFFYVVSFALAFWIVRNAKAKRYALLLSSLIIAGVLFYGLLKAHRDLLPHMGAETSFKKEIADGLLEAVFRDPLSLLGKSRFPGYADLNMSLSLVVFYLSPVFLLGARNRRARFFLFFPTMASFAAAQITVLRHVTLLATYSEFFVGTIRLVFIFMYLILGMMIVDAVLLACGWAERFLGGRIRSKGATVGLINLVGVATLAGVFALLRLFVMHGQAVETVLSEWLYPVTWIYLALFCFLAFRTFRVKADAAAPEPAPLPFLPAVPPALLAAALLITPNLWGTTADHKAQNDGLWSTNTITGIPPDVIAFVRSHIPMDSTFSVDTASRTSIFLYANVYVDYFPPLVCNNIVRQRELYQRRFDEDRPIYGDRSTVEMDLEYMRSAKIDYVMADPEVSERTRAKFEQAGAVFERVFDSNGYTIYRVSR